MISLDEKDVAVLKDRLTNKKDELLNELNKLYERNPSGGTSDIVYLERELTGCSSQLRLIKFIEEGFVGVEKYII